MKNTANNLIYYFKFNGNLCFNVRSKRTACTIEHLGTMISFVDMEFRVNWVHFHYAVDLLCFFLFLLLQLLIWAAIKFSNFSLSLFRSISSWDMYIECLFASWLYWKMKGKVFLSFLQHRTGFCLNFMVNSSSLSS